MTKCTFKNLLKNIKQVARNYQDTVSMRNQRSDPKRQQLWPWKDMTTSANLNLYLKAPWRGNPIKAQGPHETGSPGEDSPHSQLEPEQVRSQNKCELDRMNWLQNGQWRLQLLSGPGNLSMKFDLKLPLAGSSRENPINLWLKKIRDVIFLL